MTRTGRHFLYLRRDGAGGVELRRLDLARLDDALLARRAEVELAVPAQPGPETGFGDADTSDSERRTRCATDALGEHAVVHLATGELLLVALEAASTERFTYDPADGPLTTLSLAADARAILFTQPASDARYLDATTGVTTEVLAHLAEPLDRMAYGHCVFLPHTGVHYPAGAFHCQNGLNGGRPYVLRDGLFARPPVVATQGAARLFLSVGDDARVVDLRTGAATRLGAGWVGPAGSSPRLVSEAPLRVLWATPYSSLQSGVLGTQAGLVPLPFAGRVVAAGPTSALGYADGERGASVVAWSYGGAAPPTARTVATLAEAKIAELSALEPADREPASALVTTAYPSPRSVVVRATGEVEDVGAIVTVALAPRVERLAVVRSLDSASSPATCRLSVLDARQPPHRLSTLASSGGGLCPALRSVGTRPLAKVLVADPSGCRRSTALATGSAVGLEAIVRARHGLGPCAPEEAAKVVVAAGPEVDAVGLLFPQPTGADYRVIFAEP